MKLRRRNIDIFGISFLDVISCGLGAVLALVIIAENGELDIEVPSPIDVSPQVDNSFDGTELKAEIASLKEVLLGLQSRESELQTRLTASSKVLNESQEKLQLTESAESPVYGPAGSIDSIYAGGVPVGREYVIFLIDTSGSMQAYWATVVSRIRNIISAHPAVKGLQVMNDNGQYLMDGYSDRWIPDTPSARKRVMEKLETWSSFSNSSPAEGLEKALKTYARKGDAVSIYVIGDDFTGASYQLVIDTIDHWNIDPKTGERSAIIHGIGFPWGLGDRFATLMREVAIQNDGVFVGT